MTLGPIYFNGTKGAMQTVGGVQEPVIMRGADFEYWCCLPDCLETAYQEHRKALGQGEDTSTCITSDMVIAWLEANHTSFIDHDRAGAPLSDDKQSFVYFTEARWYEVAGIDDQKNSDKNISDRGIKIMHQLFFKQNINCF